MNTSATEVAEVFRAHWAQYCRVHGTSVTGLQHRVVSRTLLKIGRNNLKCQLGFFSVLHTWGQTLTLHPHLHVVIPAVGISLDGTRIVQLKKKRYFVADKVLSLVFRGMFVQLLKRAHAAGQLCGEFDDFEAFIDRTVQSNWVVRTKPPFGGPEVVLKYLARYTHRVAIGNSRLISVADGLVTFRYKDYRTAESDKQMTLSGQEFIRRFFLHLLPSGFVRVRYYGFLARAQKSDALALLRKALRAWILEKPALNPHSNICSCCNKGFLVKIAKISRLRSYFSAPAPPLS